MPRPPTRPPELENTIFCGQQAVENGLLSRTALRSSAWTPIFQGVYMDGRVPLTHRHKCLAADAFVLPGRAAIAGRSAAFLYGVPYAITDDTPVEAVVSPADRIGPQRGIRLHTSPIEPDEIREVGRVRVTSPARTCWDLAQWVDLVEAVVLVDALLRNRLVRLDQLVAYVRADPGGRGTRRLQRVIELASPAAESPQESRVRVRLVLAGVPMPAVQFVVTDGGRFVARIDLAWPDARVAVEYDGRWHAESAQQLDRDRARLNRLVAAGWQVLHLTSRRLRDDFETFVADLTRLLHR